MIALLELTGVLCVILGIFGLLHILYVPGATLLIVGVIIVLICEFVLGGPIRDRWRR